MGQQEDTEYKIKETTLCISQTCSPHRMNAVTVPVMFNLSSPILHQYSCTVYESLNYYEDTGRWPRRLCMDMAALQLTHHIQIFIWL